MENTIKQNGMNIFIGEQRKAFAPYYRDVTIRKQIGNFVIVSIGFDSKGNDITTMIDICDVLPRQL